MLESVILRVRECKVRACRAHLFGTVSIQKLSVVAPLVELDHQFEKTAHVSFEPFGRLDGSQSLFNSRVLQ